MAGSVSGDLWSFLYYLYFAIAAVVGALVVGWLTYSLVKFRYRPDRPRPADAPVAGTIPPERGHPLWSYVMAGLIAIIMFGLAFGTISAVKTIETPPCDTEECLHVEVIGYQFGWKYNYTGTNGVPFQVITPGADVYFPVGRAVAMNVTSQDVWHNFALPDFRIRVDAIPGTINHLWFNAHDEGEYRHVCVHLCGLNHARMHTMTKVVGAAEFEQWRATKADETFTQLESRIARGSAAGTVVNGTFDGSALSLASTKVAPGAPVLLNVTNEGASAVTVSVGSASVEVQPGASGRLYARAPASGSIEVVAGASRATLEVSG